MMQSQTAPYMHQRVLTDGTVKWDFRFKTSRMKQPLRVAFPDNEIEPWYSSAYALALTRTKLRPGKIREVLQSLPFSLARCIGLYKTSGELARRTPTYQMVFDNAAEMLCMRFGWVDVRQMTPGAAAFLTSRSDRPQDVGAVLSVVLAHAARQGIGAWTGQRRILSVPARTTAGPALDHSPIPDSQKVISMSARSQGRRKPRPMSRVHVPERAVQFAEVVGQGADAGWPELTVPQIMTAAWRMGIALPSERVTRDSLNTAVEMGLIARTARGTYAAIQQQAA